MAAQLPGQGVGFWLEWAEVEPRDDPAWTWANTALRQQFRKEAALIAGSEWDKSRRKGLDRFGQALAPISEYTYNHRRSAMGDADPDAPPLTPAYDLSRTRSFLRKRVTDRGVYFHWKYDPRVKRSWGVILDYHAKGMVRGAPRRDVIGFSPAELVAIREHMRRWWDARRKRVIVPAAAQMVPIGTTDAGPIIVRVPVGVKVIPREQRPNRRPLVGTGRLQLEERRAVVGIETMGGQTLGPGSIYYQQVRTPKPPAPPKATPAAPVMPRVTPVRRGGFRGGGAAVAGVLGLLAWLRQRDEERPAE